MNLVILLELLGQFGLKMAGLVTVQSMRWGEFLGILEWCDHWEMQGARGIELDLPLSPCKEEILSTGMPDCTSTMGEFRGFSIGNSRNDVIHDFFLSGSGLPKIKTMLMIHAFFPFGMDQ